MSATVVAQEFRTYFANASKWQRACPENLPQRPSRLAQTGRISMAVPQAKPGSGWRLL